MFSKTLSFPFFIVFILSTFIVLSLNSCTATKKINYTQTTSILIIPDLRAENPSPEEPCEKTTCYTTADSAFMVFYNQDQKILKIEKLHLDTIKKYQTSTAAFYARYGIGHWPLVSGGNNAMEVVVITDYGRDTVLLNLDDNYRFETDEVIRKIKLLKSENTDGSELLYDYFQDAPNGLTIWKSESFASNTLQPVLQTVNAGIYLQGTDTAGVEKILFAFEANKGFNSFSIVMENKAFWRQTDTANVVQTVIEDVYVHKNALSYCEPFDLPTVSLTVDGKQAIYYVVELININQPQPRRNELFRMLEFEKYNKNWDVNIGRLSTGTLLRTVPTHVPNTGYRITGVYNPFN